MSLPFSWVTGQWMEEVLQWAWTISLDSHLWFWWAIYLIEIVWLEFYRSQKQVSLFLKTSLFGTKKWSQYVGTKNGKFLNGHLLSCFTERLKMANKTNKQKMFTALYERLNLQFLHSQQLDHTPYQGYGHFEWQVSTLLAITVSSSLLIPWNPSCPLTWTSWLSWWPLGGFWLSVVHLTARTSIQ